MSEPEHAAPLKAALLLCRALCAQYEGDGFVLSEHGVEQNVSGSLLWYEGVRMGLSDIAVAAVMLLQTMVADFSDMVDDDPLHVAQVLEMSVSLQNIMAEAATEIFPTGS